MDRPRFYDAVLAGHFAENRQMAWVSGPRQVGKTTCCRKWGEAYLNWDAIDDRRLLLLGPAALASHLSLERLRGHPVRLVLDELHKHAKWRQLLKGFFDTQSGRVQIAVTGSSRLDVFRRGGDSLMGRYFLYRMHPWSVAECLHADVPGHPLRAPQTLANNEWDALWQHGGFPEPFLRRDPRFTRKWRTLRMEQLVRGDIRDMAAVHDLGALEALAEILSQRSSCQLVYSRLAQDIGVSVDTIKRWVDLLNRFHFGFLVRPWSARVAKSLLKEPKWFLRDWSAVEDEGARAETLVACHLLKCTEGWTDLGLGRFELRYLRDKQGREVDFLVVRDRKPWFLVEVQHADTHLSPALGYFQKALGAAHAFQAVFQIEPVQADCFTRHDPVIVPARTLLSQLL